jgi:hypothetical protein
MASVFRQFIHGVALGAALVALAPAGGAQADPIPKGWQAHNVTPIGFSGLGGRYGAFKIKAGASSTSPIRASRAM